MSRSPSPAFSLNAESWDDSAPEETKSPQRSKVASVVVKPSSPSRPSRRDSTTTPRKRSPSPSTRQPAAKSRRESSTPAPSRKNTAFCPHCNTLVSKPLRRHFAHNHLPWYADPARICWVCETTFISNSELEQHFTGRCQNGQFVNFTAKWCLFNQRDALPSCPRLKRNLSRWADAVRHQPPEAAANGGDYTNE